MTFDQLGIIEPILKALHAEGYTNPTPIQQQAIPLLLQGKDLLGCAQTGTGKTAAFAIPILQLLSEAPASKSKVPPIRALILTPTRELAIQIDESFGTYGRNLGLRHTVVFGGVGQKPQTDALARGIDILIATPGRLLDLMQQGFVNLRELKMFVLDEADRMLDMGFINDVRKVIAKLPEQRHTLFFSATMPPEIQKLANNILRNPVKVEVTPISSTAEKVGQSIYFVEKKEKQHLLHQLLDNPEIRSMLIFTRTKHGANKVAQSLTKYGIRAEAIHGNKSQTARQTALANFKKGVTRVLVATDIAARGIDIDELSHVLNFELPNVPETYVHRIGRTGRAGASGLAISFCDGEERAFLRDIERLIGQKIPVLPTPAMLASAKPEPQEERPPRPERRAPAKQVQQQRPPQQQQSPRQQSQGNNGPSDRRPMRGNDRPLGSWMTREEDNRQPIAPRPERQERPIQPNRPQQQPNRPVQQGNQQPLDRPTQQSNQQQADRRPVQNNRPQQPPRGAQLGQKIDTLDGQQRNNAENNRPVQPGNNRPQQPGNNPNRPPQGNGNKQVKDAQSTSKSSSDWSDLDEFNW